MARVVKHSHAVWTDGTQFAITSGSGHTVIADGDSQAGMSPMEMLLGSLIGCTAADVISILQKKRQEVTAMEVHVAGTRAEDHPRVYTDIAVTFVVTGHGVDPDAVRRAIDLSETKYCSVSAMLRSTAKLTMEFEVREASTLAA